MIQRKERVIWYKRVYGIYLFTRICYVITLFISIHVLIFYFTIKDKYVNFYNIFTIIFDVMFISCIILSILRYLHIYMISIFVFRSNEYNNTLTEYLNLFLNKAICDISKIEIIMDKKFKKDLNRFFNKMNRR